MATIRDTDRGMKKRVKALKGLDGRVTVGILEAEGGADHGGRSVLEIAIWQEFGTRTIPSRSFLRDWFDENEARIEEAWRRMALSVASGKRTNKQALKIFGKWAVGEIQARISQGIPPPLKEATIRRKGSSVPLIDTGQLRSSITAKVELS